MAYADPVDPATPADSDISGQGDDRIREFKRGIRQRLLSFFFDVDADPLVPKDGVLRSEMFPDDEIDGSKLAPGSVNADRLSGGGGGGGGVTDNSVYTAALQDNSVTHPKLANNAVEADKIADGAVTGPKIANAVVNTVHLVDGAVNRPKLAAPMRGVLGYVTKGAFNVPAGNLLSGPTYRKVINIPVALNAVVSPNAMAIVYSVAMADAVIIAANIVGGNIVCGIRDYENQGTKDLSGTVLNWMVIQPYEGAVPE